MSLPREGVALSRAEATARRHSEQGLSFSPIFSPLSLSCGCLLLPPFFGSQERESRWSARRSPRGISLRAVGEDGKGRGERRGGAERLEVPERGAPRGGPGEPPPTPFVPELPDRPPSSGGEPPPASRASTPAAYSFRVWAPRGWGAAHACDTRGAAYTQWLLLIFNAC